MQILISVLVTTVLLLTACIAATGQRIVTLTQKAEALFVPEVTIPLEALATGLGGNVDVLVRIDNTGKVIGIEGISGPSSTCPSVTRTDVLAIRAEAERVALGTTFTPAMADGEAIEFTTTITIIFETPRRNNETANAAGGGNAASENEGYNQEDKFTISAAPQRTGANSPDKQIPSTVDRVSGGVLNGRAIRLAKPPFPPAARAVRASGAVTVQVLVLEDGTVFSAQALSGHPLLRAASKAAACESTFQPVTLAGQPVRVSGVITYNFVP